MWYKMMFLFQVSKTKGVGMEHTTTHSDLISLAEFQTKWGKSSHNKGSILFRSQLSHPGFPCQSGIHHGQDQHASGW